jgi:hypothetical protein
VQFLNVDDDAREARNHETVRRFAPDIAGDRWDRAMFSWGGGGVGVGVALRGLALGCGPA